ncbi:hypothetical protein IWZ03DRAFT_73584 [Phyllosticta citriasiana]|uniref:Uncharacterized protein n=1 Tax=Phyllosticta citriasiana TaxID=595635 RepID=A0ABR1KGC3_9PEZI
MAWRGDGEQSNAKADQARLARAGRFVSRRKAKCHDTNDEPVTIFFSFSPLSFCCVCLCIFFLRRTFYSVHLGLVKLVDRQTYLPDPLSLASVICIVSLHMCICTVIGTLATADCERRAIGDMAISSLKLSRIRIRIPQSKNGLANSVGNDRPHPSSYASNAARLISQPPSPPQIFPERYHPDATAHPKRLSRFPAYLRACAQWHESWQLI